MSEDNKRILRRLLEALDTGNLAVVEELVSPDFVTHHPRSPDHRGGPEAVKQASALFRTAFHDLRFTIEDMIAEGDMVAFRWIARGTHTGEYFGIPPTGESVEFRGMEFDRFSHGKVEERWVNWDTLGLFQQLGIVPELGQLLPQCRPER